MLVGTADKAQAWDSDRLIQTTSANQTRGISIQQRVRAGVRSTHLALPDKAFYIGTVDGVHRARRFRQRSDGSMATEIWEHPDGTWKLAGEMPYVPVTAFWPLEGDRYLAASFLGFVKPDKPEQRSLFAVVRPGKDTDFEVVEVVDLGIDMWEIVRPKDPSKPRTTARLKPEWTGLSATWSGR